MQNAHLLLSERDKSLDQRYGLSLDESIALYKQTVSVTSEIFENAIVVLVIGEKLRCWSNIDNIEISPDMSQALRTWLAKTSSI